MGGVIFLQNTEKAFRRFEAQGVDTGRYMGAHGQKGIFLDLEEEESIKRSSAKVCAK